MSALNLRVDELLLDAENPRFVHGASQRDVLQKILDDQREKLFSLAESISADGMNPVERLLVLRDSKQTSKFVVLEGNRRLAALTILENPSILSSLELAAPLRRRFEEVAAQTPEMFPKVGGMHITGPPVKLSATPGAVQSEAPKLGADTRAALEQLLGLDDDSLEALAKSGAIP